MKINLYLGCLFDFILVTLKFLIGFPFYILFCLTGKDRFRDSFLKFVPFAYKNLFYSEEEVIKETDEINDRLSLVGGMYNQDLLDKAAVESVIRFGFIVRTETLPNDTRYLINKVTNYLEPLDDYIIFEESTGQYFLALLLSKESSKQTSFLLGNPSKKAVEFIEEFVNKKAFRSKSNFLN